MSEITPPGCFLLDSNVYFDQSPISNHAWQEYRYWLKRIYGANSPEFRSSLQDTAVWMSQEHHVPNLALFYHDHFMYRTWPVIGVSREQAQRYSQWRSDRVAEMILIQSGYRDIGLGDTFTIARLRENRVQLIKPLPESFQVPKYRISSVAWYKFAIDSTIDHLTCYSGLDFDPAKKKNRARVAFEMDDIEFVADFFSKHLVEMTSDSSYVRGDWCEELSEQGDVPYVTIQNNHVMTFRNTCSWEPLFGNMAQN